jgi:hypothetical protein
VQNQQEESHEGQQAHEDKIISLELEVHNGLEHDERIFQYYRLLEEIGYQ